MALRGAENQAGGHRVVFLSSEELDRLLATVKAAATQARHTGAYRPIIDEAIVMLLVDLGLQPRELLALKIGDLPTAGSGNVIWIRGRRDRRRSMTISPQTADVLQRFVQTHRTQASPQEPLFLSERGTSLSYMSLHSKLARIGTQIGCNHLTPGLLRRTFLKRLCKREQDLRIIQRHTGHSSYKTTARFLRKLDAQPSQGDNLEVADTAQALRRKPTGGRDGTHRMARQRDALPGQADHRRQIRVACEACGKPLVRSGGTRIDSGQILCTDCICELRSTSGRSAPPCKHQ